MILDRISDRDFTFSEFGDFEVLGMLYSFWLLLLFGVVVGGCAVLVCCSHVNETGVFAGPTSICCNPPRPPHAIAGGGSVGILQRFVLDVWFRVGSEGPDFEDGFHYGFICIALLHEHSRGVIILQTAVRPLLDARGLQFWGESCDQANVLADMMLCTCGNH